MLAILVAGVGTTPAPLSGRAPASVLSGAAAAALPDQEAVGEGRAAGDGERAVHRVTEASAEVRVDGILDEPVWRRAEVIRLPYEWTPGDNAPAPVETECMLAYDEESLYWGCRAHDPRPERIRAYLGDRDTRFSDDHVLLLIDTFDDQRRAFQFRVNPRGVQMDAILSRGSEDFSWDAIWNSAGRLTDGGYVVEVAIPFESLSFQRTDGEQTWGFILERSWPRSARHRMRQMPTDRSDPCLLCQAEKLVGFRGVRPGGRIELNPTLTASRTDARPGLEADELDTGDIELDPGLNVRWRVTSNIALDGTINPDFSQVEADAAQLEVNRRFALFFPEKRPFFLEGADFFRTPMDLVFTRTVVDPSAGAKLTGKVGGHALGGFVTRDEANNLVFPGPQSSSGTLLDRDVTGAVFRYRRDVGGSSTLGALVTDRESGEYHNRLFAMDGNLRLSRSNSVVFQAVHTDTRYPEEMAEEFGQPRGAFSGQAYAAQFIHDSRNWYAFATYLDLDERLRADAGFVPQVGLRGPEAGLFYAFWGDADRWFNRIGLGGDFQRLEDRDGELLEQRAEASIEYEGPLQSFVNLDLTWDRQRFAGETFDLRGWDLFARVQPSGDVTLDLFTGVGEGIDFANVREADRFRINPGVSWRIGAHVEAEAEHTLERLSLRGEEIFTANLTEARVLYHFDRRAFLRAIVQYRHVSRNPALFQRPVEEAEERLFTQLLFSYKVNPRTVLFAGYSDNRRGETDIPLTETSRSFFLKVGYAWRP